MTKTIVVSEDGMFTSEPVAVTDMASLFCSAITAAVHQLIPRFPEDCKEAIKKELFDCLNLAFSKCLENSFPEYELHPEITEEVLAKENALIMEKLAEVEADK